MIVGRLEDLDASALVRVAHGEHVEPAARLLDDLGRTRQRTLDALSGGRAVYGVSTGMGSLSHLAVGAGDQPSYQDDLMLARAVGTAPWLDRRSVRAAVAARLATLLPAEVGASPALVEALAALLRHDLHPAVPSSGNGAAGEIIPLAHLGGALTGTGEVLGADGSPMPAGEAWRATGLATYHFGPKEGVAFLQGTPVALGLAALLAADVRRLAAQQLAVAAAEIAGVRAPRDPYDASSGRGDPELARVLAALRALVGPEPEPRVLQAPVSFRVVGPTLAHLLRAVGHLDGALARGLGGVSTSPALVDGRFLGTAGFDGFDLAACADGARLAVLHVAEVAAARLHRLLDPRVTGLTAQLSAEPGRQAGLVALHKRVVGLLHEQRRAAAPASLGAVETSLGQEDVQSFGLEAVLAARSAADVLADVTACEVVAVHQAQLLDPAADRGSERLKTVLRKAFAVLPETTADRPTGREVSALRGIIGLGWADDMLGSTPDDVSHLPSPSETNPY